MWWRRSTPKRRSERRSALTFHLPYSLRDRLVAEARAAYPRECCGLVEGVRDGEAVRALALHPVANVAEDPAGGFLIDPAVHLRLSRSLRGSGREIVACYHSHPDGRVQPSARDRASGTAEDFVWVIAGVADEVSLAAYEGPDFRPVALAF
jgi:desampylase